MFTSKLKKASDPHTDYVTLRKMITSKSVKVRSAIAANRNLQTYLYPDLAQDSSVKVRSALATNPNMTWEVWAILNEDSSPAVRETLLKHFPERPDKRSHRAG